MPKKKDIKNPRIEVTVRPEEFDDFWAATTGRRTKPQDVLRAFIRNYIEQNPTPKTKVRVN